MDILRGFIGKKINESISNPSVQDWFQNIPPEYLALLCIGCIFSTISVILAILHLIYVLSFISNEQIRTDLYFFVFMCPAISLCGSIGMILPRAALFLYALALVYFMLCLFVCITLMTTLHGSRSAMCEKLMERGVRISVRVMPIGCCFFCFPKLAPSEFNFRRIEWLVFQSPILNKRDNIFFQISNLIGIISLFIGSYGSYMIIPPGSQLLSAYRFSLLFRLVDFSQLAYSVQKFVFDFLAAVGVITNGTLLPDTAKAQFFTSFLLTFEMLVVSIAATILFRPSQTIFFDKYNGGQTRVRDASSSVDVPAIADVDNYNKPAVPRLALTLEEVVLGGGSGAGSGSLPAANRHYESNIQFTNLSHGMAGTKEETSTDQPTDQQPHFSNLNNHHSLDVYSFGESVSPTGLSPEHTNLGSVSSMLVGTTTTSHAGKISHRNSETIYSVAGNEAKGTPVYSNFSNGNDVVLVEPTRRATVGLAAVSLKHTVNHNRVMA
uniref:Organic solute transporter alpha-like protein n=1 Tax=Ditylenchus dipsaci TaxID=166011 RepID=A0A915DWE7_9BILA